MTDTLSLFDHEDYKAYLRSMLATSGVNRGLRTKLAAKLNCKLAFISQVVNGSLDLTPEHAMVVSDFFSHTKEERGYFLLLVQYSRAGSKHLKDHCLEQIKAVQARRSKISNRLKIEKQVSESQQAKYYSSWYYAAIHVLLSIPKFQEKKAIADHLHLPLALVSEVLDSLEEMGFAKRQGGRFEIGEMRLHLNQSSPFLRQHHSNWRMKAIQSLEKPQTHSAKDLHFSGVWSLSQSDVEKVREIFVKALERAEPILRASPEETLRGFCIDFFSLE